MNPEKLCEWIQRSYRNWKLRRIRCVAVSCISNAKIMEDRMWEFKWLLSTGASRKVGKIIKVLRISCCVWSYLTSWNFTERMAERGRYCINRNDSRSYLRRLRITVEMSELVLSPLGKNRDLVCVRTVFWGEYSDVREGWYQKYGENYILRNFVVLTLYSVFLGDEINVDKMGLA